jgi:cobalamin biosynthesis Co2+ chelatase CbiK
MSMQALNRLVARSIIDPTVLQAFGSGHIGEVLDDLDFSPEMRRALSGLEAESWSEFAIQAYRVVKAAERPAVRIELPSPLEGLIHDQASKRSDFGQVA